MAPTIMSPGTFWPRLVFPKLQSGTLNVSGGAKHSLQNWQIPVSCTDTFERNKIQLAIEDFHNKTSIRFRQTDPQTDSVYVNITGEYTGCRSYVGRIGRVSIMVQGVVNAASTYNTQIHTDLFNATNPPI
jgi:hypothetical protein